MLKNYYYYLVNFFDYGIQWCRASTHLFPPIHVHALYGMTSMLIIGIIMQHLWYPLCVVIPSCAVSIVTITSLYATSVFPGAAARTLILMIMSFISGAGITFYQCRQHFQTPIIVAKNIRVRGTITDIQSLEHTRFTHRITLKLHNNPALPAPLQQASIYVYIARIRDLLRVADNIEIQDITIKSAQYNDFGLHLLKEGISGTAFVGTLHATLIERPTYSFMRCIHEKRTVLLESLSKKMNPQTASLYASLFLGNRTLGKAYINDLVEHFRYWGISHHLARSGLHLVIFAITWERLFRYLPLAYIYRQFILFALGIVYYVLSWSSISFIRAFSCFMLYKCSNFFHVSSHVVYTLVLVCAAVLIYNPIQLFFLDFQLSFALTFALAWFNQTYTPYIP